jgi:pimeloyl-ACP methyl ester carboxylesterase
MNVNPTSHFITLNNRPIVQKNGEIIHGSLRLHYWQWKGHSPTVLICHGGAFHGRCYDRIINEALAGYHVIALDFRGHGRSQKHPPPYPFPWFGEDLLQFIELLNLSKTNLLGIGHSLGGHALIFASTIASRPLFQSLLLLDPAIYAPHFYTIVDRNMQIDSIVLRRKCQWSSIEDMISYMETRQALSKWPKDIIRDYCTYALDENFQLACTPEQELSLYIASIESNANIYQLIKESKYINNISITIVRASTGLVPDKYGIPPTAIDLVTYFKKSRDTQLENAGHLFPMEQPEITIGFVKEFIEDYKNFHSHL